MARWLVLGVVAIVAACAAQSTEPQTEVVPKTDDPAHAEAVALNNLPAVEAPREKKPPIDQSGRTESGKASYYGGKFEGRKMADGNRLNQSTNVAASKTLPIGTTAKVTNLETGKSATVKIEDRGPYTAGRSIDVSSSVANKLDIKKGGVAPVEVKPITLPQRDGSIKLGAGAAMASRDEVRDAERTTRELAQ